MAETTTPSAETAEQVQVTVAKRVGQFIAIRDELDKMDERHKEERKGLLEAKELVTGWLQTFLEQSGSESIKTTLGTCYASSRTTASVADPKAFMDHVIATKDFDLLDRRANATAVKEYVKEHNGQTPPGVNISTMKTLGVRRPGAAKD